MAPQASWKYGLPPSDHHHIGSCTSNGIDLEQVPGICSVLTISYLPAQVSAQSENRFLRLSLDRLLLFKAKHRNEIDQSNKADNSGRLANCFSILVILAEK